MDDANEFNEPREMRTTFETAAIMSSLTIVYKYSQIMVSKRLAHERPEISYEVFCFLMVRLFQNLRFG